jgi:MoaA/NifB/PqqE/SkfB family radical SAM enzyme
VTHSQHFGPVKAPSDLEAELLALRAEVEAQRMQLRLAADRMRAFEQLVAAIRQSRIYTVLRAFGRWEGVEQTAAYLLTTPTASPDAAEVEAASVRIPEPPHLVALTHNIPSVLPAGFDCIAAFRIRNVGRATVHLPAQHTAFWGSGTSAPAHALAVAVDGHFVLHAQIPNDRIEPDETVTVFFPLHAGPDGEHHVQIHLTSTAANASATDDRVELLDVAYRADATSTAPDLLARLINRVFVWRYGEWPRLLGVVRCSRARRAFETARDPEHRQTVLQRLKDENRQLAFLEKQMRRERVASRPCYLTIDSTVDCNLHCPLCYREDVNAARVLPKQSNMLPAVVDELVRTLLPTAITISPSGWGEPLLSPHLDTLLDACSKYGVFMSFTTNGVLLNRKGLLDKLIPVLHWLEISVDSVNPALFEQLRAGARFEQVMRNAREIGRIRASRPQPAFNFGFSMTLFRENLEEVPAMLQLVADCGGNFLKTDIGVIFNQANVNRSALQRPQAYNEVYARSHERASVLGLKLFMRSPFVGGDRSEAGRYGVCDSLYTHASMSTDGSYRPCYSSILPSRASSGSQDLLRLWNSPDIRRLRRDHDSDRASSSCKTCYVTLRGRDSLANRKDRFIRLESV